MLLCNQSVSKRFFFLPGDQIMSQLTGFGHQSMSHHFQQMESGLQHQHNLHHILHQGQLSSHQQQQASPQPQRMAQNLSGGFPNQTGGVPYVKIVEQPAGNKLRFRLVFADIVYHYVINSIVIRSFCVFCIIQ